MATTPQRTRRRRSRRRVAALTVCALLALAVAFGIINILLERSAVVPPAARADQRLVVLIHGLDEPGTIWNDLTPALVDAGFAVELFQYPNDQPVAPSAALLHAELTRLRERGVERIDIVAHSMGGLVARDALTRAEFDQSLQPEVGRLIMVGPPNQGSPWAPLQPVSELREALIRWAGAFGDPEATETLATDGAGEAAIDLTPGSAFLTELNSRPLPEGVEITIIAAQATPVDAGALADATRSLLGEARGERVRAAAGDLVNSVGDGVVPLESTRIEGVDDFVVVSANHRSMLKRLALEREVRGDRGFTPPAIPIILDRLREDDQE
jgi:triacylglycerol esterase/lipase EstA (alpha/beta hydrolase family)